MNTLARLSLGLLVLLPLATFVWGYKLGSNRPKVVLAYQDAPKTQTVSEKSIGSVAGTVSAERLLYQLPKRRTVPAQKGAQGGFASEDVWGELNSFRQAQGLKAFSKDQVLCEFAHTRLADLKSNGRLDGHAGFNSRVQTYLTTHGFQKLAENLAEGYGSPAEVIQGWRGSAAHYATMISSEFDRGCISTGSSLTVLLVGRK